MPSYPEADGAETEVLFSPAWKEDGIGAIAAVDTKVSPIPMCNRCAAASVR
jgi:hypothetical protein